MSGTLHQTNLFQAAILSVLTAAVYILIVTNSLIAQPASPVSPEQQLRATIESGKVEQAVAMVDKLGREKGLAIAYESARTLKEPVARYALYVIREREEKSTIGFYVEILKRNPPKNFWEHCRFALRRVNAREFVKDQLECLRLPWTDEQKEKFVLTVADYKTAERRFIQRAVIDGKLEKQVLLDWKPPSDTDHIALLKKLAAEEKSQRVQLTYYSVAAKWGDTDSLNKLHLEFQEAVNQMKGIKDLLDEKDKAVAPARQRFERAVSNLLYVNHPASALCFLQLLSDARPYNKTPAKDNEQPKPERLCDYAVRRIQTLAGRVKDFPKLPEDTQFSNEIISQMVQWLRSNQKTLQNP